MKQGIGAALVGLLATVSLALPLGSCGSSDEADNDGGGGGSGGGTNITGSVDGFSFGSSLRTAAIARDAGTQLNGDDTEALSLHIGEQGSFTNFCPDIGTSDDAKSLSIRLQGASADVKSYPFCAGGCTAPYAELAFLDGESFFGTDATSGEVTLTEYGPRAKGSFTATFEGGSFQGTFDIPVSCRDSN